MLTDDKNHIFNFNNITIDSIRTSALQDGIEFIELQTQTERGVGMSHLVPGYVHFIFNLQGSVKFLFSPSQYSLELEAGNFYSLYNPMDKVAFQIVCEPKSQVIILQLDAKVLHGLFMDVMSEISFLEGENAQKKFYRKSAMEHQLYVPLNQLFSDDVAANTRKLYQRAKIYEILSISFGVRENPDEEACPFLKDTDNVKKIRLAKKILMESMANPPTLKELCKQTGMNEYNLKSGFRNIYGQPVMTWLNTYRMEMARKYLTESRTPITEVAEILGYHSSSHFIETFRKKFGITPKRYQQSLEKNHSWES